MRDKIYVVTGTTGWDDEDRKYWPVIAYFNEQSAVEHAEKAEARAKEIWPQWLPAAGGVWEKGLNGKNEHDPYMEKEGDVLYLVYSVEIADTNECGASPRNRDGGGGV